MKFACLSWAALALALVAVPAPAAPCNTPVCNTPYTPPAVAVVSPTVVLPLYGAAYTGESDAETRDLLLQLLKEIQALRADLKSRPADTGDGPPVPPLKAVDVLGLLKSRCNSCHNAKASEEKGGGLDLFTADDQPIQLQPATRRDVIKKTASGAMPPPGKGAALTAAERQAIRDALTDAAAKPIPKGK